MPGGGVALLRAAEAIISKDLIVQAKKFIIENISVNDDITDYISKVVQSTRVKEGVILGASPTASVSLLNAARGHAAIINGKDNVTIDDVKAVAFDVLNHRITIKQFDISDSGSDPSEYLTIEKIISEILGNGEE